MNKQLLILALSALVIPAIAQQTNQIPRGRGEWRPGQEKGERPERPHSSRRSDMTTGQKEKMEEYRVQLMEKALKKIGVSDEQQGQIEELQRTHKEKMRIVSQRSGEARKKLSALQKSGAAEKQLGAAIDEICALQKEQLWILVRNRMEMEEILGKEKFALFMESARTQFESHGRRGGSNMPPRPGFSTEERSGAPNPPPPGT
ncbi:Spy/CpxP family protein refolding chaperone [Pontiella sulfatireligans]|uniref:Periplasmic heavy metal sensor n=1 Tax=Pontiella sulfatireligans TaxID=2750658 RepID=A0A6C2UQ22_9BACT|nr:hypothetical protein [Pontiella sulfatireligans]VGO22169.1 hypothetical protein SCARR_04251 [Pontiella sulfatireligans]